MDNYLVAIATKLGLTNALGQFKGYVHLGATSTYVDGKRKWKWLSSGRELKHFNWKEGEPNDNLECGQNCLKIDVRNSKWVDHQCGELDTACVCRKLFFGCSLPHTLPYRSGLCRNTNVATSPNLGNDRDSKCH